MVPFPVTLSDGLNYIWDFQNKGGINRGSNAVFDGAFLNLDLPNVTQAKESLGGRMFNLSGDSRYVQDIALSGSVYVPDNAGWVPKRICLMEGMAMISSTAALAMTGFWQPWQ